MNHLKILVLHKQFLTESKIVSDMRQVSGFLRVLQFPPPIKLT